MSTSEVPSDQSLLFKVVQGDQQAFRKFYDRHKNELLKQAIRRSNYSVDPEEVFVDFFSSFTTKLFKRKEVFINDICNNHQNSALPYMMTMVRNLTIDFQRSSNRRLQRERPLLISDSEMKENSIGFIEPSDPQVEEKSETIDLYQDSLKLIWDAVNSLKKTSFRNDKSEFERKKLEKEIDRSTKEAKLLQNIFELLYIDGCTCTEVSKKLKIDPKTLRVKRENLRNILNSYFSD